MTLFTRLSTSALAAITAIAVPAAAFADNSFSAHSSLVDAVREVGVKVYLNEPQVCDGKVDGVYLSAIKALVICQDNAKEARKQVAWTSNDMDTLRHEVHHMVQDCAAFRLGDQALRPVLGSDQNVMRFAINTLGERKVQKIIKQYAARGTNRRDMLLELEAWAVAPSVSASSIEKSVRHFCTTPN